jgi:hypothetical protein
MTCKTRTLKKICITLLLSLSAVLVQAQNNYFKTVTLQMENNFAFPVFSLKNDSVVTKKINAFIQLSELELLKGYEKKNPFERVAIGLKNPVPGKEMIQYVLNQNNERLLSVAFTESYCNWGCNYWCSYYNFNSKTGELVYLKDLFTQEGYAVFRQMLSAKRLQGYEERKSKLDSTSKADYLNLPNCYEIDPLQDFTIRNDSLLIDGTKCFGKGLAKMDLNPITGFTLKELPKYLNPYGLILFGFSKGDLKIQASHQLPQLFSGNIGNDSIYLILNVLPDISFTGIHFNRNDGVSRQLMGKIVNGQLHLTEMDASGKEQGCLEANFNGPTLEGVQLNKERTTKKTFKVHL